MEIVNLVLILLLARFTWKCLFDEKYFKNIKLTIDRIKRKYWFWSLMRQDNLDIPDIFKLYIVNFKKKLPINNLLLIHELDQNNISNQESTLKKVIKQSNTSFKNFQILFSEIENREKSIEGLLKCYSFSIEKSDINRRFKKYKEDRIFWEDDFIKRYDDIVSYFIQLINNNTNLLDIWEKRKLFEDKMSKKYKFFNDEKIDFFINTKLSQQYIGEVFTNILCEKIKDTERSTQLKILISEWEKLHMLRWCIINYDDTWIIWKFIIKTFF